MRRPSQWFASVFGRGNGARATSWENLQVSVKHFSWPAGGDVHSFHLNYLLVAPMEATVCAGLPDPASSHMSTSTASEQDRSVQVSSCPLGEKKTDIMMWSGAGSGSAQEKAN